MPKSVTKVTKDGVQYTSSVERVQYTIEELSRAALRDIGKLLRKRVKDATPVDTGTLRKNIGTWVRRSKDGPPRLQIGVYNRQRARRRGLKDAFYAGWQEFGTSKMPAANAGRGYLASTVEDHLEDIRRITGQYLSAVENENRALGLIDEEEEIADDEA